jgi:hypothetical protein
MQQRASRCSATNSAIRRQRACGFPRAGPQPARGPGGADWSQDRWPDLGTRQLELHPRGDDERSVAADSDAGGLSPRLDVDDHPFAAVDGHAELGDDAATGLLADGSCKARPVRQTVFIAATSRLAGAWSTPSRSRAAPDERGAAASRVVEGAVVGTVEPVLHEAVPLGRLDGAGLHKAADGGQLEAGEGLSSARCPVGSCRRGGCRRPVPPPRCRRVHTSRASGPNSSLQTRRDGTASSEASAGIPPSAAAADGLDSRAASGLCPARRTAPGCTRVDGPHWLPVDGPIVAPDAGGPRRRLPELI